MGLSAASARISSFKLFNGLEFYLIPTSSHLVTYSTWVGLSGANNVRAASTLQGVLSYKESLNRKSQKLHSEISYQSYSDSYHSEFTARVNKAYLPQLMKLESNKLRSFPLSYGQWKKFNATARAQYSSRVLSEAQESINHTLGFVEEFVRGFLLPYIPDITELLSREACGNYQGRSGDLLNEYNLVLRFYNDYYVPPNIKIYVQGAITLKELKALAIRYYNKVAAPRNVAFHYANQFREASNPSDALWSDIDIKLKARSHEYLVLSFGNRESTNFGAKSFNLEDTLVLWLLKQYLQDTDGSALIASLRYSGLLVSANNFAVLYNPVVGGVFTIVLKVDAASKLSTLSTKVVRQKVKRALALTFAQGISKAHWTKSYQELVGSLSYESYGLVKLLARLQLMGYPALKAEATLARIRGYNVGKSIAAWDRLAGNQLGGTNYRLLRIGYGESNE